MRFFLNVLCLLFVSIPFTFATNVPTDSLETKSRVFTDSLAVADSLSSLNATLPNYSNSPYLEGLFNAEPSMLMLPPDNAGILGSYGVQPEVWRPAKPYEPGVDAGGDLNLSIPIMTVPGRNGLDFPINFNYRSGILVDQPSGWLGLGWSFDPGSITRDVSEHTFPNLQTFQNFGQPIEYATPNSCIQENPSCQSVDSCYLGDSTTSFSCQVRGRFQDGGVSVAVLTEAGQKIDLGLNNTRYDQSCTQNDGKISLSTDESDSMFAKFNQKCNNNTYINCNRSQTTSPNGTHTVSATALIPKQVCTSTCNTYYYPVQQTCTTKPNHWITKVFNNRWNQTFFISGATYKHDEKDATLYLPDNYFASGPFGYFNFTKRNSTANNNLQNVDDFKETETGTSGDIVITPWQPHKVKMVFGTGANVSEVQQFVVTTPDGTRYLYGRNEALDTSKEGGFYLHTPLSVIQYIENSGQWAGLNTQRTGESFTNVWRLSAVLGQDFPGEQIPLDTDKGSWLRFEYKRGTVNAEFVTNQPGTTSTQNIKPVFLSGIYTPTHYALFDVRARDESTNARGSYLHSIKLYNRSAEYFNGALEPTNMVLLQQGTFVSLVGGVKRSKLDAILMEGYRGNTQPGFKFEYHELELSSTSTYGGDLTANNAMDFPLQEYSNSMGYLNTTKLDATIVADEGKHSWSLKSATFPTGYKEVYEYESDMVLNNNINYIYLERSKPFNIATSLATNFANPSSISFQDLTVNANGKYGGIRIKNIKRYENISATTYLKTDYTYGNGYLSGVPRYTQKYFKRDFRDDARIYYSNITKSLSHGAKMVTNYSTQENFDLAIVSPSLWIGEGNYTASEKYGVAFSGNNIEMWGKVLEVREDNDISTKTTKYTYTPQRTAVADILPANLDYGVNIQYYSFLANDLTQKQSEIKDKRNNKVFSTTETYTYNRLNQLQTIETKSDGLPTLLKVLNYAHEIPAYQELFTRNLLTPVAQETTWEKVSSSEFKLHGSSISQIAKFNNHWFAKKSWVLKDEIRTGFLAYTSSGSLPLYPSAPKFTAWNNDETCASTYQEAYTNGIWQCTGRNMSYDDNGRLTKSESPSGAITELFFGSDANPCSNQPTDTLYKGNYLTCAQITLGTEVLSKTIKYENADFKNPWLNITHVSNLNNTDAQKFKYDNLGRLTQVQSYQNGQWLTLNETSYGFLLKTDGTIDTALPANRAITKTYPTGAINTTDFRESATFYDGLGREVLMSSRLTPFEIIYKQTQYDIYDRPTRVYKPFRYSFATAYGGLLRPTSTELEDGVKGYYDNALYPYQDLTYNNANIVTKAVHPRMSATSEEFVGSDMSYENYKRLDNSLSPTQGASVSKQVSEDGSYTLAYSDLYGRTYRTEKWNLGVLQSVTASEFDAMGRVVKMYPPNYFMPPDGSTKDHWVTTYSYNTLGQITSKKSPDAAEIKYLYDHAGNLRYAQDGNQRQAWKFSYTSYDAANRPLFSGEKTGDFTSLNPFKTPTDELSVQNHTLSYNVYDKKPVTALPSRTTEINALSQENLKGQLAVTAYRIGSPEQVSYPPYYIASNLWQTTALSYDEQGRIKQKTQFTDNAGISLPALSIQYEYNALGEPYQVKKTLGTQKFNEYFEYNLLGQVAKVYNHHGEFPTKTTTTGGTKPLVNKFLEETEGTVFDAAYTKAQTGLSFVIPNSQYLKVVNAYLPTGQLDTQTFVGPTNGVGGFYTMDYSYNMRDLLTEINKPSTASHLTYFSAKYTHSPVGNIETAEFYNPFANGVPLTHNNSSLTEKQRYKLRYTYDPQYRLTATQFEQCGANCTNAFTNHFAESLSYDPNGNIKTLQRSNENGSLIDNLSYQYATNNCLLSVNDATNQSLGWDGKSQSFQYDSNGNIILDGKYSYQYDVRNLPISLFQSGTMNGVEYRYNAAGSRIYKRNSKGVTEYYIMDGEMPIALINGAGILQYWNTSYGKYVKVGTSYSAQYYLKDHLGSVRVVLDQSGNRTQSQDYYAYGLSMPTRSYFGSTKEGFTGKETDLETGLQYFGARYYMPHLGRWMAIDPLAEKEPDKSPYNYVGNDPVSYLDPDGKFRIDAYFASKYPALARVVQYYLPQVEHNPRVLNALSGVSGFSTQQIAQHFQFGQGPWISVQRDNEPSSIQFSEVFSDAGSSNGIEEGLPDNLFISRNSVNTLEYKARQFLRGQINGSELDIAVLGVTVRIVHEMGHWLEYQGRGEGTANRGKDERVETGARVEEFIFGTRFSYRFTDPEAGSNGFQERVLRQWYWSPNTDRTSSTLTGIAPSPRTWQVARYNHFNNSVQPQRGDMSLIKYPPIIK